ncbi:MAG: hypothetical protein VXW67_06380 [Bacteroidota bacterium]|nr:hypothetical protein [Bacteroidota bacterium]
MPKQKLIIDRKSFLEWKFSDSDDYDDLIYIVEKQLEEKDVATVSLDDLISNVGYVPSHIIENELPKKFIDEYGTVDEDGDLEEIESFPTQDWYYVEWINTEDNG